MWGGPWIFVVDHTSFSPPCCESRCPGLTTETKDFYQHRHNLAHPPSACLQKTQLHWCYMVLCAQASEILIQTLIYKLSSIHLQFWEYLYSTIASHASVLPVLLAEQRCRSWTWPQREHIYEKAPFSKTESSYFWVLWIDFLGVDLWVRGD